MVYKLDAIDIIKILNLKYVGYQEKLDKYAKEKNIKILVVL